MNKEFDCSIIVEYIKKESSDFNGKSINYFFCNFYKPDGMSSPMKIRVTPEQFAVNYAKGDKLAISVAVRSDYLSLTASQIVKEKIVQNK